MRTVLMAGHLFSDLEGLGAALAQAGAGIGLQVRSAELAVEPLQQQLANGACLVLAYLAPAVGVGRALKAAGEGHALPVASLLTEWRSAGEAMLALAVRHPGQCLLVNAEAACAVPARLVEQANHAFGLDLNPAAAGSGVPATMALTSLEALLAAALVAADPQAAAHYIELESCAHLGQDEPGSTDQLAQLAWIQARAQLTADAERTAALAQAAARQAALEEQVQSLTRDRDQQLTLATSAAEALRAKVAESVNLLTQAAARRAALEEQVQSLTLDRDQRASSAASAADALEAKSAESASQLAQAAARQAALEEQLESLTRDRNQQMTLAKSAAEALEVKEVEAVRQNALVQQLQREGESLLLQLHEAHLESEACFKEADDLRAELQAARAEAAAAQSAVVEQRNAAAAQKIQLQVHAGALQQTQEQLARLKAEHVDTLARHAALQAETEGHRQIRQERDRSRLQLMQAHADSARLLESGQRDAALRAEAEATLQMLQFFWRNQQPLEVRIDLARDISGSNWYPPESDGRWTGPELVSTLVLPALKPGSYRLEMTLVGAMNAQIGAGLRLELNGRPLDVSFNRIKHPRVGTASFEAPPAKDGTWVLSLRVPAVESPAGRGGSDQRRLGVRVAELKFIAPVKG